jgi:hypothetical protein
MAFKPNYRFERAERDRLKKARKDEKLRRQQDRASLRQDSSSSETTEPGNLLDPPDRTSNV